MVFQPIEIRTKTQTSHVPSHLLTEVCCAGAQTGGSKHLKLEFSHLDVHIIVNINTMI
jgi:hypothetical protein